MTTTDPVIIYEKCTTIPKAQKGSLWPEEKFLHDPDPEDVLELADPRNSKIWIDGSNVVKVGATVRVRAQLYDGRGIRKKTGGDLVSIYFYYIHLHEISVQISLQIYIKRIFVF